MDNTIKYDEGGQIQRHKSWNELSLSEKSEMIKVAVMNGITDLPTIKEKYNEFAEGGDTKELWTMEDEAKYREWRNSLPDNLRLTNDNDYDMRGAFKAGMQPTLESDGLYHLGSRDPETGRILKAPHHPTYLQAINTDARMGYYPMVDDKGQTYTQTWEGNLFADGGIHIKPENRGKFTALKERTGHSATWFKEHGTPAQKKMATFALNARKWKHGLGGPLVEDALNYYVGGGNTNDTKVEDIGMNRHLDEVDKGGSFWQNFLIGALKTFGIDKKYKKTDADTLYRRNLYNIIDPTNAIPHDVKSAFEFKDNMDMAMSDSLYPYTRKHVEPSADAAFAKRLGLPYDESILISNPDGSVHLSKKYEDEIPVDTNFLKDRIQDNQYLFKRLEQNGTDTPERRKAILDGIAADRQALDSLRHTYNTGEPVVMSEFSHTSRHWVNDGNVDSDRITPLSPLHNYTIWYDRDKNEMHYLDYYDFNRFEDFVPGEPFTIKGSIKLKK